MQRLLAISKALLATAALTLVATAAQAQSGINLSWTDCGTAGALQRNFACNTNTGANIMVGSVVTGVDMGQLNGQASVMDLQTNQPALSPWWLIGVGQCRIASTATADFNFTAASGACFDAWAGAAAGGINYQIGFGGANKARIRTVCAIPGNTPILGTDELYMFKVNINNSRTVGTGSCAGCTDGACIVFNSILVTQPAGVGDYTISTPITRNYVQWQGGGNIGGQCPGAVPTKSATWGSVKSLYR